MRDSELYASPCSPLIAVPFMRYQLAALQAVRVQVRVEVGQLLLHQLPH